MDWKEMNRLFEESVGTVSIFRHVMLHKNLYGPGLLPGGDELPDRGDFFQTGELDWLPGARDILVSTPKLIEPEERKRVESDFVSALERVSSEPSAENIGLLENVLSYPDTLSVVDRVLKRIVSDRKLDQAVIYGVCRHIVLNSVSRSAVKFCISLMGLYGRREDLRLFLNLGRHEEFTLYCAVALISSPGETARWWMELARNVTGWGRIHIVLRLVDEPEQSVKDFLLREMTENDVSVQYTALPIVRSVKVEKVLSAGRIDGAVFKGAGRILSALVRTAVLPGAFRGVEEYKRSFQAVKGYLKQAESMAEDLEDFANIELMGKTCVTMAWGGCRERLRWKPEEFAEVERAVSGIMSKARWNILIEKSLRTGGRAEQEMAMESAREKGIDVGVILLEILSSNPVQPHLWAGAMEMASPEDVEQVLELAEDTVLKMYLDGEKSSITVVNWQLEQCISALVRGLIRFPRKGLRFLTAFLEGADRNLILSALKILNCWGGFDQADRLFDTLRDLMNDPDESVSISAENILRKNACVRSGERHD